MIVTKLMHLTKCIDASTRNAIERETGRRGRIAKGNDAYAGGEEERWERGAMR